MTSVSLFSSLGNRYHHLSLAFLNKSLGTFLIAYIDVLAVFHCECFYYLTILKATCLS